ncbi:MAG: hypothetical protein ACTHNK_12580 [Thermomicrobiales bacterium]
MSSITSSSAISRHPAAVNVAMVLMILLGLSVLLPVNTGDVPAVAIAIGFVLAALKIVAGIGLWWSPKWAAILGFVVVLLDALLAAPGIPGSSGALQVYLIIGVLVSIVVLVLLALPALRRAYV